MAGMWAAPQGLSEDTTGSCCHLGDGDTTAVLRILQAGSSVDNGPGTRAQCYPLAPEEPHTS